jgi:hypothetical protein
VGRPSKGKKDRRSIPLLSGSRRHDTLKQKQKSKHSLCGDLSVSGRAAHLLSEKSYRRCGGGVAAALSSQREIVFARAQDSYANALSGLSFFWSPPPKQPPPMLLFQGGKTAPCVVFANIPRLFCFMVRWVGDAFS